MGFFKTKLEKEMVRLAKARKEETFAAEDEVRTCEAHTAGRLAWEHAYKTDGIPDEEVTRLQGVMEQAARASALAQTRHTKAKAVREECDQSVEAAKLEAGDEEVLQVMREEGLPAMNALIKFNAKLEATIARHGWHRHHGKAIPSITLNGARLWLAMLQNTVSPRESPKAPAGTVMVRFLKSFAGKMVMDTNVPTFSDGEIAGFAPAVAAELHRAGIVEYAKDAA